MLCAWCEEEKGQWGAEFVVVNSKKGRCNATSITTFSTDSIFNLSSCDGTRVAFLAFNSSRHALKRYPLFVVSYRNNHWAVILRFRPWAQIPLLRRHALIASDHLTLLFLMSQVLRFSSGQPGTHNYTALVILLEGIHTEMVKLWIFLLGVCYELASNL